MSEIFNIVIGTAGHIDHGKSALVCALTGVDPDRLKEEKERGLTIDLGFAPLILPDGRKVGIIDVPGHEKFVKNMVAGASGIDFVILVIAADDSVMPQTREHLEIMQLLGIDQGMVVLTKIDLVDEELVLLATEEISEFLAPTFLDTAPIVPMSSVTGQGLEEFRTTLFSELTKVVPRQSQGIFRMPIQRVFSKHGHGTVITGVPVSGSVSIGDSLEILPGGYKGRVKKIQAYGTATGRAQAGHSSALNLKDVDYKSIERGQVAAAPGYFFPERFFEARLTYLAGMKTPLTHMTPIRFHTGTLEAMGRVAILGRQQLQPGESGYVQIRLEEPVVAVAGDRFVLRLSSPMVTIAGGVIIGSSNKKLKRFRQTIVAELYSKEQAVDNEVARLELLVRQAGDDLVKESELFKKAQMQQESYDQALATLLTQESIAVIGNSPRRYIHAETITSLCRRCRNVIDDFFRANPYRLYLKKLHLKNQLQMESVLLDLILGRLGAAQQVSVVADAIQVTGRQINFSSEQQRLVTALEQNFIDQLYTPGAANELGEHFGKSTQEISALLEYLCECGRLIEVARGLFFHHQAIATARQLIIDNIRARGELVSSEFRDQLQTSRKYIIPLLDYFDHIGLTVRSGSSRVLRAYD